MRHFSMMVACVLALAGCDSSSSGGGDTTQQSADGFVGACYASSEVDTSNSCSERYDSSVSESQATSDCNGQFTAGEACNTDRATFGGCKIVLGDDGAYEKTYWYAMVNGQDQLTEQLALCSAAYDEFETPEWQALDATWGATEGYGETFNASNGSAPADFTVADGECDIQDNRLHCQSVFNGNTTGTGSTDTGAGKATFQTPSSAPNQRVTAQVSAIGGDYGGGGTSWPAFVFVSNNSAFLSATDVLACGFQQDQFTLLSANPDAETNSAIEQKAISQLLTQGAEVTVQLSVEGTSVSCVATGDIEAEINHTLGSPRTGAGYAGVLAGYRSGGPERNFAYWDNFKFEERN